MIVDYKTRVRIINDYFHKKEEEYLKTLNISEEEIQGKISKPINWFDEEK